MIKPGDVMRVNKPYVEQEVYVLVLSEWGGPANRVDGRYLVSPLSTEGAPMLRGEYATKDAHFPVSMPCFALTVATQVLQRVSTVVGRMPEAVRKNSSVLYFSLLEGTPVPQDMIEDTGYRAQEKLTDTEFMGHVRDTRRKFSVLGQLSWIYEDILDESANIKKAPKALNILINRIWER